MYFSCKLTSTIIKHFSQKGEDLAPLIEELALPPEFLADPSSWIDSQKFELFLSRLIKRFGADEAVLTEVAHRSPELKTWGVLDAVLRILPRSEEVWAQPEKMLSHFVSPPPPVANVVRKDHSISFDVPILSEQYPLATHFLQGCFESIPCFNGRPLAHVDWASLRLTIDWSHEGRTLFDQQDPGYQVSPELMRQLVFDLESNQRELQEKKAQLQRSRDLLESQFEARGTSKGPVSPPVSDISDEDVLSLRQHIGRITDYMVRAQQLISICGSQDKNLKAMKEAMRKLDWEYVREQFPKTVEDTYKILDRHH